LELLLDFISGSESGSSLESSSSSSNESGDSAANLGSEKHGPVTLDENMCPEGCEQELYDMTLKLRAER
jgi:hypothetical protein